MKKFIFVFLALFMGCEIAMANSQYVGSQKQKEAEPIIRVQLRQCGLRSSPIKIAALATNPPFSWTETEMQENNVLYTGKGFLIDFMQQILNELNISTQIVGYPTDDKMLADFQIGKVDMVVGMYYDPKIQLGGHAFLNPSIMQNLVSVIFMKGKEKKVEKFEDLVGLKGVVRQDEKFYDYIRLKHTKMLEIQEAIDSKEAFTKLLTGEVDYMLSSPYAAEAEARRFKLNLNIAMSQMPLMGQEFFVLYSGNSLCPQYRQEIAAKIKEKRQDMNAMKRDLISYINNWGQRFKNDPSLVSQLQKEQSQLQQEQK